MKKIPGFKLQEVCGEKLLVPFGESNIDFSNMISMNESAAYLWDAIGDEPFTLDDVVRLLCDEYEVEEEVARSDAQQLIKQWTEAGLVE